MKTFDVERGTNRASAGLPTPQNHSHHTPRLDNMAEGKAGKEGGGYVLYRTIPYYTVLYRTIPYCTVLYCCCTVLYILYIHHRYERCGIRAKLGAGCISGWPASSHVHLPLPLAETSNGHSRTPPANASSTIMYHELPWLWNGVYLYIPMTTVYRHLLPPFPRSFLPSTPLEDRAASCRPPSVSRPMRGRVPLVHFQPFLQNVTGSKGQMNPPPGLTSSGESKEENNLDQAPSQALPHTLSLSPLIPTR